MMLKQTLVFCHLIIFLTPIFGQKVDSIIYLSNPSFEDYPSANHTPKNWLNCGFAGESEPDTQPSGAFNVTKTAYDGKTYVGLVVRDVGTREAIGQKLSKPMIKNIKYSFSVYTCQSKDYEGRSQLTGKETRYREQPAVIKIWGSNNECERKELLAQSEPIDFKDWKKLTFTLAPKADYKYFVMEAFFIKVFKYAYNGNILIDNASAIVPILDKN
jgi:hypothetical protein